MWAHGSLNLFAPSRCQISIHPLRVPAETTVRYVHCTSSFVIGQTSIRKIVNMVRASHQSPSSHPSSKVLLSQHPSSPRTGRPGQGLTRRFLLSQKPQGQLKRVRRTSGKPETSAMTLLLQHSGAIRCPQGRIVGRYIANRQNLLV